MDKCAPIILVFAKSKSELASALSEFVRSETDISYYDEFASPQNRDRLLYNGIELQVTLGSCPEDLAEYRPIFLKTDSSKADTGLHIDFGENVAGGAQVAPIAQILMQFSARLGLVLGAIGVAWTPARLLSEPAYFADAVTSYVEGGAFPVLSTVDFQLSDDVLKTQGLNWFSGQEIELAGDRLSDNELVRRAVRIVHDIAVNGPVLVAQNVPDLDEGKFVSLSPSDVNGTVAVRIQSNVELSPS